jgi:hypothetical protein
VPEHPHPAVCVEEVRQGILATEGISTSASAGAGGAERNLPHAQNISTVAGAAARYTIAFSSAISIVRHGPTRSSTPTTRSPAPTRTRTTWVIPTRNDFGGICIPWMLALDRIGPGGNPCRWTARSGEHVRRPITTHGWPEVKSVWICRRSGTAPLSCAQCSTSTAGSNEASWLTMMRWPLPTSSAGVGSRAGYASTSKLSACRRESERTSAVHPLAVPRSENSVLIAPSCSTRGW